MKQKWTTIQDVGVDLAIKMVHANPSRINWERVRTAFAMRKWRYTTASRCAARYAELQGCTLVEAGATFNVAVSAVCLAKQREYR